MEMHYVCIICPLLLLGVDPFPFSIYVATITIYAWPCYSHQSVQVAHLVVSLATVLIIRYSPAVNETYDADLDTLPRAALIAPPLLLALVFNKASDEWSHI